MHGPDPRDPNTFPVQLGDFRSVNLSGLRAALWTECKGTVVTSGTQSIVEDAARRLEKHGISISSDKPPMADEIYDISSSLYSPFFTESWETVLKDHGVEKLGPIDLDMIRELADWKRRHTAKQLEDFQLRLSDLKTEFLVFMERYDIVISPVIATPAPKHATTLRNPRALSFVQLPAYVPAIPSGSVPCGFSKGDANSKRLPIGVQVVGRQFREDTVLAVMHALEREFGGWMAPNL
jgi:Asp-tRNA(Asn)/Glu-tRNA(Gln) amidotransferase A subunit family amidase